MAILVSGGAGYIGSHTCIELLNAGYDIVVADNYYNASPVVLDRVKQITGKDFRFYKADMTRREDVEKIFSECPDITAVIQFAAYKAVGESVSKPIEYYYNNLNCTLVILDVMRHHDCHNFVFSSSATVYGDPASVPITEDFPVGACVGPKGSRVRAVVGELRGERVDVILWDADPAVYVANALSPAKVTRVLIDEEKAYAGVIVPDDQLSLAIGKEGQNARLAARLTGWHIDIKSETLAADILKNVPVHEEPAADLISDEDEDVRRCEYVSEDGIQCRNQARPGSRFCGVHDTDAFDDAEDLI